MKKSLALLGSTGSIGSSTLKAIENQNFKITDNSVVSIIIDSFLISVIYTVVIYFMKVSKPINKLIRNILNGKFRP